MGNILRIKQADGTFMPVPVVQGDRGPEGPQGPKGEPGSASIAISDNTINVNQTWSSAKVHEEDELIKAIAVGKNRARVFTTVAALDTWLADDVNTAELLVGDNFYIVDKSVPDYWWDGSEKQELETQKVDLTAYYNKEETEAIALEKAKTHTLVFKALDTLEEIETYYNTYDSSLEDSAHYQFACYFDVAHPTLVGSMHYVEGFKASGGYGWQIDKSYSDEGMNIFFRSCNGNVWGEWVANTHQSESTPTASAEWTLVGSVTKGATITLPETFQEVYIEAMYEPAWISYVFTIPRAVLTSNDKICRTGGYVSTTDCADVMVSVSTAGVHVYRAKVNNADALEKMTLKCYCK